MESAIAGAMLLALPIVDLLSRPAALDAIHAAAGIIAAALLVVAAAVIVHSKGLR